MIAGILNKYFPTLPPVTISSMSVLGAQAVEEAVKVVIGGLSTFRAVSEVPAYGSMASVCIGISVFAVAYKVTEVFLEYGSDCIAERKGERYEPKRGSIVAQFKSLMPNMNKEDESEILKVLEEFPKEEWQPIIQTILPLIHDELTTRQVTAMLRAIAVIPDQEIRKEIAESCLALMCNKPRGNMYSVLYAVGSIPAEERRDIIGLFCSLPLDHATLQGADVGFILSNIAWLPKDKRACIIQASLPLISADLSCHQMFYIFQAIEAFPEGESLSIIEISLSLHDQSEKAGMIDILQAVAALSESKRKLIVEMALLFLKEGDTPILKLELLRVLDQIPECHLGEPLRQVASLFSTIEDPSLRVAVLLVIQGFSSAVVVEDLAELHEALASIDADAPVFEATESLLFLDPKDRMMALQAFLKMEISAISSVYPQQCIRLLDHLFQTNPEMKKRSLDYLLGVINLSTNTEEVSRHFRIISDNQDFYGLSEDDPLFQVALSRYIDAIHLVEPRNPYVIFRKQLELAKTPTTFQPSVDPVIGASLNLAPFQERLKRVEIKNKEVDSPLAFTALQDLFNDLDRRISQITDEAKKQALLESIRKRLDAPLSSIASSVVNEPTNYFKGLLQEAQDPESKASIEKVKLCASLAYIQTLRNTLEEGEKFTPREEAFLTFCMNLLTCKGGKQEGVAAFYHYIQSSNLIPRGRTLESDDAITPLVDGVIDTTFNALFSSESAFMRDITGIPQGESISQPQHQLIYIKNMIGSVIGLQQDLQFDHHTGCVYQELAQKTREEILTTFYNHFTPLFLVSRLQKKVREELAALAQEVEGNPSADDLLLAKEYSFLGGFTAFFGEELPAHVETFHRDPDTDHLTGLSEKAALAILGKMGYLNLS